MASNIPALILLSFALVASFAVIVRAEAEFEVEDSSSSTNEAKDMADFRGLLENPEVDMDEDDFNKDGAKVCWWADKSGCETCCLDANFVNHYWDEQNGCTCDIPYENGGEQSSENHTDNDNVGDKASKMR